MRFDGKPSCPVTHTHTPARLRTLGKGVITVRVNASIHVGPGKQAFLVSYSFSVLIAKR